MLLLNNPRGFSFLWSLGVMQLLMVVRVLKVNCKGCEYKLVNDSPLRLFDIAKN